MRVQALARPAAAILVMTLLCAPVGQAQDHLVSREALSAMLRDVTTTRRAERAMLADLVDAAASVGSSRFARLRAASAVVPFLSDDDARELAARARALRADPAAGELSNEYILLIVVGGAALIAVALWDFNKSGLGDSPL